MSPKHHLSALGQFSISVEGQTICYTIKRSPRIRYVRIELRPQTGITVVVPKALDVAEIPKILKAKSQWLLSKLAKLKQRKKPAAIKSGDTILYLGREIELAVRENQDCYYAQLAMDKLIVGLKSGGNGNVAALLRQWYRWQSYHFLARKAKELSTRLGITYNRLVIRGQKTRWASCSQRGTLSFNWKLLMTPEPVIDYVITHELIHLKEMNHSKRFWALVEESCPDWRKQRKWLKEHEAQLSARLLT